MRNASFYAGLKLGLPIMIGYIPLGFAFGVLAVKNGMDEIGRASCRERV